VSSSTRPSEDRPAAAALGRRVDQVCDAFEAAWRAGRRPAIADYLGDTPEPARSVLLRELIALDAIYRRQAGEAPRPGDYHPHFASAPADWLADVLKAAPGPPAIPGYEIFGEIARGGMGVVYEAQHLALGRRVALKLIAPGRPASEVAVRRFRQGARAASALDHPNIVPIYEIGEHQGQPYLTMALVQGVSLREFVCRHGPPAPPRTLAIMTALAEAVEFAHRGGVLHRDLKPENVMMDGAGRPRVTDFGLARRLEEEGLTLTGQVLGTPAYMAPEQALARRRMVGPAADVYGLGGILYFLLTGRAPFQAAGAVELLAAVVGRPVVPPRRLNPAAAPALEAVCLKCLEKDPARRYPSAAALGEALRQAVPAGPPPAGRRPRPARAGLLAAAGVLLALGVVLLSQQWDRWWGPESAEALPLRLPAAPARQDFPLEVELLGGRPAADGTCWLLEGQRVTFRVKADRDAHVGLWTIGPDGKVVRLFPNAFEPDNRLRGGQARVLPGAGWQVKATLGPGPERVWLLAATEPWDVRRPAAARQKAAVAEQILRYQVAPRPRFLGPLARSGAALTQR
jgi:hypothetical protein